MTLGQHRRDQHLDELDDYLARQPQTTRDAAADAEEFLRFLGALVAVRMGSGVRQEDVAVAMGTAQSAISDLESGRTDPQLSTLMRYARAVGAQVRLSMTADREEQGDDHRNHR